MNTLDIESYARLISFGGWGKPIIIGLRIFAGCGLMAFVGLNIALWFSIRIR